ncbi:energy transducer TonB [Arcicella sp. LKC2W]|uniref:energy transducer TonB n=1 Tax=Arcicella sp. LKC2W TaxID=2984198 RepID=UPI002B1EE369|nr:energy transducer TonB [Arcicella sp. LKC2W]MEA5457708.1 energy transducer TonB [Arcicella sp. LKC2W]
MKKTPLLFFLLFSITSSFAQDFITEPNLILRFIESTVQIPFMAEVEGIKDTVSIRVTTNDLGSPIKYEIVKGRREDCNKEALRVVKLLNNRLLKSKMNGEKEIILDVPFRSFGKINYTKGSVNQYYDANKKKTFKKEDYRYVSKYLVDTLTGIIRSNIVFLDLKGQNPEQEMKLGLLQIDSSEYHHREIFEDENINYKQYIFRTKQVETFPIIEHKRYSNGQMVDVSKQYTVSISPSSMLSTFGRCSYFPNGRIKKEWIITKTQKVCYDWLANGQIKSIETEELIKRDSSYEVGVSRRKIISLWDSLGTQIVKDGNGDAVFYEGYGNNIEVVSGKIIDGMKEGEWVAKSKTGKIVYRENIEHNKLISGVSYANDIETPYTRIEEYAEYLGGMGKFAGHLMNNLKYPTVAQKAHVSGKVYVQFTVCTDGTLCDFNVLKSVGFGCDEEAIRVLQASSGNWKAGTERGKPYRSKLTIPINFQLSN